MKEKISALMDGELNDEVPANVIAQIRHSRHLQGEWETYHLIGDILRYPETAPLDITGRVARALEQEPAILAPKRPDRQEPGKKASMPSVFAIAASITAVAAVAWVSLQTTEQAVTGNRHMAVADRPMLEEAITKVSFSPATPAAAEEDDQINDYLLAHEEFSHQMVAQGVSHYIHTIAAVQEHPDR